MTEQQFREMLAYGREQTGVEYKGPGSRTANKHLFAKVIRALLSMANRRNGGMVIIGVDEDVDGKLAPTGLAEDDLETWNKYDDLADAIARYADPNINFDLELLEYENHKYIVIRVHEFDDIPILCKKDYPEVLREGACYVRTRRKPETAEIPTQTEMRDLLELATIKALRKYISVAHEAGFEITEVARQDDSQLFSRQLGDLVEEQ
jgi:predicted HTH transcriptional regulator